MVSEKPIKSFKIKRHKSTAYLWDNYFFSNFLITFRDSYYAKYVFDIFNIVDFFRFLLYCEVLKFWSYIKLSTGSIGKASLIKVLT